VAGFEKRRKTPFLQKRLSFKPSSPISFFDHILQKPNMETRYQ